MNNSPFALSFNKKTLQCISQLTEMNRILESFCAEHPPTQIYIITGVRSSGKTVMMTNIATEFRKRADWIVVELNSTHDMLQSLAAEIYKIPELNTLFINAKLDFSAFGLGMPIENAAPVTDIENALEHMLKYIQKIQMRLLITVDNVTNSENIRIFANSFQIFLRNDYPIFLLLAGLYDNIYDLQNDKSVAFLYRTPKLVVEDPAYRSLPGDTVEVITELLNLEELAEESIKHMEKDEVGRERYNMCKAWIEIKEEEQKIGKEIGDSSRTRIVVTNMLKRGYSTEDICAIAECSEQVVNELRESLSE